SVVRQFVTVVAPFSVSPDSARAFMLAAIRHTPLVVEHPEPVVATVDYDERGIIYEVRYFISQFDKREIVESDVRERIWYALRREGHGIPVPARRVELVRRSARDQLDGSNSADFRYQLLSRLELFEGLTQAEIRALAEHCRHQFYGHEEL